MPGSTEAYQGQRAVRIAGAGLQIIVLPELGAKIISMVSDRTGREFVWQDPKRSLRPIHPGSEYGDNDISGIDDCFPTIDPCHYPSAPFDTVVLGDHGDVWSCPWESSIGPDGASFSVRGTTIPFRLEKMITVEPARSRILVSYALTATSDQRVEYQWAAHPLFQAEPGTRIELPRGTAAQTRFATGHRLEPGRQWSWPQAPAVDHRLCDVSLVGTADAGLNEKYWLAAAEGCCELRYPTGDQRLRIEWPAATLPWVAVCVNYGGWPSTDPGHWVAVEPSTSPHDSLADTAASGLARTIRPGDTHRWWWSLAERTKDGCH